METQTNSEQIQLPTLDYLLDTTILESALDDEIKEAYLQQLHQTSSKMFYAKPYSEDDFSSWGEWRALSIRFYKHAGIEGQLWDEWDSASELSAVLASMSLEAKKDVPSLQQLEAEVKEMMGKILDEMDAQARVEANTAAMGVLNISK